MREIGHGAYGTVYLGTLENRSDPFSNECVAVKVCRRSDVGNERYERELRGAKLYCSIPSQEGLIRMRDFGEAEWGFYTVMDLADDEFGDSLESPEGYRPKTLASVIKGEKALPLKECIKIALSLAKGLAALQRHHLLHRDIKPGNVLYVKDQPVLSDPGLLVDESDAASCVGTPGYVPPEKFTDAASDIYSLGLTLKAASFGRQVEDIDKGPAMEADTGATLFPIWWRILNKATDPTLSRRYQSAKALLKDVKTLHFKMAVVSKLGSRATRAAILAASVAVVAFIGVLVVRNGRMSNEVSKQKEAIAQQRNEASVQREEIDRQTKEITAQREQIDRQNKKMFAQQNQIDRQSKEMTAQQEQIDRLNKEIASRREDISRQEATIRSQNEEIVGKLDEIARQREENDKQRREIDKRAQEVSKQAKEITGQMSEMMLQRELMVKQRREIDKRAQELAKQAKEISGQIEAHSLLAGNETNLVAELQSLRQFKADTENMFKRAERDTLWGCWVSPWGNFDYDDMFKDDIERVAATDRVRAEKMRSLLGNLLAFVKKEKTIINEIDALRTVANMKVKMGMDDDYEFQEGKKLHEERRRISNGKSVVFKQLRKLAE